MADAKVILIGGAPMTGKSTVARLLAGRLGYGVISTDDIGQAIEAVTTAASHPAMHRMAGQDYREYYVTRSVEQLVAEADQRHAAMRPALERVIRAHAGWGTPMVMEGWALLPEAVAALADATIRSIWLVADEALLERRVRQDDFWRGASDEEAMIRHFLGRSLAYNARIHEEANRLALAVVRVSAEQTPEMLVDRCRQYCRSSWQLTTDN